MPIVEAEMMVETMVMTEQMMLTEPLVKSSSVSLASSTKSTTCPPTLSSSASSAKMSVAVVSSDPLLEVLRKKGPHVLRNVQSNECVCRPEVFCDKC